MVLFLNCVANVYELSIFKYQEVVLLCQIYQALDRRVAKVLHDINVGFEYGDVRPKIFHLRLVS